MEYEYSDKQKDVLRAVTKNKLGFINILDGSVRSGKTFISNLAWCIFVLESPHDTFLMSGESTDSLYRNVIADVIQILGTKRATYKDSAKGGAQLEIIYNGQTKICYCRGGSKSNDEGKIRGITIGGWYADEITLHHKDFIKQAIARMSLKGAKALWTTNPDSPYHPIKVEYIDKCDANGYRRWHFILEDNLTLGDEYKENIKKAYSGLFYDRFIKGLWVLAQGIIYDMFSRENNVVPTVYRAYTKRYVSIDYGTQNPTTFGMYSLWGKQWYKEKEYHHSGREERLQKTDEEYANDLEKFVDNDKNIEIIVDPSAASFIAVLRQRKFKVRKANNDVLNGILNTSTVIKNKTILFNDCNIRTFKEFETYIWDDKATLKGEDKPVKENDHHMDNLRYFVNTILKQNQKPYSEAVNSQGLGVRKESSWRKKGSAIF